MLPENKSRPNSRNFVYEVFQTLRNFEQYLYNGWTNYRHKYLERQRIFFIKVTEYKFFREGVIIRYLRKSRGRVQVSEGKVQSSVSLKRQLIYFPNSFT
jgi:hypothetical protein